MVPRVNKGNIEYHLTITKTFQKEEKKECVRFIFETTEEFSYFRYLISINHVVKDKEINFFLRGLQPKGMTMPGNGTAITSIDFFDLKGEYKVRIYKQGYSVNEFMLKFTTKAVKLTKGIKGKKKFIDVAC